MLSELREQRVLGALRLVDRVTGASLNRPLRVRSESARLVRNVRGWYVVTQASGLEGHSSSFLAPPETPGLETIATTIDVSDPQKRYLPRRAILRLPRDPDPEHKDSAGSLFRPQDVLMYPASTAALSPNWSTVRATVTQGPDPQTAPPVQGGLIRIIDAAAGTVLASGISDQRGEALIIVPGVPVTKFAAGEADDGPPGGGPPGGGPPGGGPPGGGPPGGGNGHDTAQPVLVNTLTVRLELSLAGPASWPVNPDLLEQNHEANRRVSKDLELATGRMERVAINVT